MMMARVQAFRKTLVPLVVVLFIWYVLFHQRKVARSDSWEPLAAVILNSHSNEISEKNMPKVNGVPKIIHQLWRTEDSVPELFRPWIQTWLTVNPDWEYWLWTDETMEEFIRHKYPAYLDLYQSYPHKSYRVDAVRYFILFEYGGIYADLDIECLRPLSDYIQQHGCFVSQEPLAHAHFLSPTGIPLVSNALMGCSPGHPFYDYVIRNLASRTGLFGWTGVLAATGPYMLTDSYKRYATSTQFISGVEEIQHVHLAEPEEFQPSLDSSMVDSMRQMCIHSKGHSLSRGFDGLQKQICEQVIGYDFKDKPAVNSLTNHHWTHSWAGPRHDPRGILNDKRTFSVKDLKT